MLPIGTIVVLKGTKKAVMITGYLQKTTNGTVYDYTAVTYPEGYLDARLQAVFNHDQIDEVVFRGYEDNHGEREKFIQFLSFRKTKHTIKT